MQYFVILDFEATCMKDKLIRPQEIIEFPSVIIEINQNKIISEFQEYIKPVYNPILTDFCTDLTGITQKIIDNGKDLKTVVKLYNSWLFQNGLTIDNFIIVTCGNWDLRDIYQSQCKLSKIKIDKHFTRWINAKNIFEKFYGKKSGSQSEMLNHLSIKQVGRAHSGIDDCRNLSLIMMKTINDGYIFSKNDISY